MTGSRGTTDSGAVEPAGNVTQLFLNLSPTPPAQISMFARMFPSLSELHLGGNGIASVKVRQLRHIVFGRFLRVCQLYPMHAV